METCRDRREMPMGHKGREVHKAGAVEQGKLMNYEQNGSRSMSDDNRQIFQAVETTMFKVGGVIRIYRRIICSLINFEDEMQQCQQCEYLFLLGHMQ
eukprot:14543616-Heterocapsa_arctica.AAC.1